jgi:nitrogen fixation NifU-like protein
MAFNYDRMEKIENPDGYGKRTGDCGDTVEMFLTISKNGIIEHVSLAIEGCVNTIACANTIGFMVEGKSVENGWTITPEKVAGYLKTLDEEHFHCAELSCGAFYLALTNYKEMQKKGWKKNYLK